VIFRGSCERLGPAVGVCGCCTTFFSRSQTAIDAVPVGVVGDNEHTLLGLRHAGHQASQGSEANQNCAHEVLGNVLLAGRTSFVCENAMKIVNRRLTLRFARSSNFSRVFRCLKRALDGTHVTNHCAAMNGLNHICGICPEIIR
jgi:hypothetical protein